MGRAPHNCPSSGFLRHREQCKFREALARLDLFDAKLRNADLRRASLTFSNLTGADLSGANLSGAQVIEVRGLIQEQLDKACGDQTTLLSPGLTLRRCSD
jgi:uncharacterized protein YjbI with pentapeptide repeats